MHWSPGEYGPLPSMDPVAYLVGTQAAPRFTVGTISLGRKEEKSGEGRLDASAAPNLTIAELMPTPRIDRQGDTSHVFHLVIGTLYY